MIRRPIYEDYVPGLTRQMLRWSRPPVLMPEPRAKRLKQQKLFMLCVAVFVLPALLIGWLPREYTSSAEFLGLPWVAIGDFPRAWIAIGACPIGLISLGALPIGGLVWGGITLGVLSIGGISFGLFCFGGVGVALIAAVGGLALAPYALAGMSLGLYAFAGGGCAWGYFLADGDQHESLFNSQQ